MKGPRPAGATFERAVYRLVHRVPAGRVVTYGQVAALLGAPRRARAVGHAMRTCPPGVPWHRVVNALGGVSRRKDLESMLSQRLLLEAERVRFVRGRVDLARHRFRRRSPGEVFNPGAPGRRTH